MQLRAPQGRRGRKDPAPPDPMCPWKAGRGKVSLLGSTLPWWAFCAKPLSPGERLSPYPAPSAAALLQPLRPGRDLLHSESSNKVETCVVTFLLHCISYKKIRKNTTLIAVGLNERAYCFPVAADTDTPSQKLIQQSFPGAQQNLETNGASSLSALMKTAHYHDQKLQCLQPVPILNVHFQWLL